MRTTIRFDQRGGIDCLYTEAINLRVLGRLDVVRATEIAFDPEDQRWEVRDAAFGKLLFADPSRAACLAWERSNLQPGTTVPSSTNRKSRSIMKKSIIVVIILAVALAAAPAFVHRAVLVDQEVVADVAPALGDGVVAVDAAHDAGRLLRGVGVAAGGVVQHDPAHRVRGRG